MRSASAKRRWLPRRRSARRCRSLDPARHRLSRCLAASRAAAGRAAPSTGRRLRARAAGRGSLGVRARPVDRPGELMEVRQRERRIEIVFERVAHRPQRRVGFAKPLEHGVARQGQRAVEAIERLPRLAQPLARSSRAGRDNASVSSARRITSPGASSSNSRTVRILPSGFRHLGAGDRSASRYASNTGRNGRPPCAQVLCAISFSWCGKIRSRPPPWMSKVSPRCVSLIAEHSMCQPGRPRPQGLSQPGWSGSDGFHSTKSAGVALVGRDLDPGAGDHVVAAAPRQLRRNRGRRRPEQHMALGRIGVARRRSAARSSRSSAGCTRSRAARYRAAERRAPPCPRENAAVVRAVRAGRSARRSCARRGYDLVLDIGDVADIGDVLRAVDVAQQPVQHVEDDDRPRRCRYGRGRRRSDRRHRGARSAGSSGSNGSLRRVSEL